MKAIKPTALRRLGRTQGGIRRPGRRIHDQELLRLRGRLLRPLLGETDNPMLQAGLKRAAAEAESLAWLTPFPLLVLPGLFEEKTREARHYAIRQANLRESSREWLGHAE